MKMTSKPLLLHTIRRSASDSGFVGTTYTKKEKLKKGKGSYSRHEKHKSPVY